ncbi:unnamed protein product [Medioppia subpectinata]|uniref:Uncharacterized protein n=1 Tax=Medioppia subpectinata TaxID=1979941 RepID=A0A7R9KM43_9ACAR|nr:unnamed protein product [Medioppia subpectinata]CAG2106142.1 unnamed protein product [Medioppia subpectinata]
MVFVSETTRLVKEIEDYRNECMDNMPKQVAGFLLYSGKSMIKQFCRKGSKSVDKLLDAGVCGNAGIAQDNLQDVKQCTHDRQEVIFSMVRQVSGRTMDVFCGEYNEGSDKCDKLEKPPKKLKSQRRTKSFAIPIIDVLKGFPEI